MTAAEMSARPIVQCSRLSAVWRASFSHSPGSYWFDWKFVFGIRSTPSGKRAVWCAVHVSSLWTTASASTTPAAHATYQPNGRRTQIQPTNDRSTDGSSAQSQTRASVADVGSWNCVIRWWTPFHWMTYGFSCASVDAMSDEKKSGIAMNDAIAH